MSRSVRTALILIVLILLPASTLWPTSAALARPAARSSDRLVLALYYPWFDMNTWNEDTVPDYPAQLYVSSERETIQRQVSQARQAGLDGFVSAWAGRGNQTEANFATLLAVSQGTEFRSTVYFETPNFTDQGTVVESLRHILRTHAGHPNFLRHQGKPVLFFWALRSVPRAGGQSALQAWQGIRDQADPQRTAVWIGEGDDPSFLRVFDGIHMYSIAWASSPAAALANYARKVRSTAEQLGAQKLWVATAMPGYDDLHTGRSGAFRVDRRGGAYYRTTFEGAIATDPDWILITSWNEWVEGSQIEPSRSDGNLYVDLTAQMATGFRGAAAATPVSTAGPDYDIPGGHFYTQTNGRGGEGGQGFAITNLGGIPLWNEYRRLGGATVLGYPVSRRLVWDGFVMQATQRVVLQWRPEVGQVYFANVFDILHERGKDAWLEAVRATPPPFDTAADSGLPWSQVVQRHLALLDGNPAIASAYWNDANALQHYGLPMSYADYGNVFVVRAQRAVFQQWKVNVPWARAGQVTIANGGDVAKEAGLFPAAALESEEPAR